MAKMLRNTVTGEVYPINADLMRRGDMVEFDPENEPKAEPEAVDVVETVAAVEPEVPEESNAPADEFASLGPVPDDLELDLEL